MKKEILLILIAILFFPLSGFGSTKPQTRAIIAAPGGDMTGVAAGAGLVGGGQSGAVTLNIGGGTGIIVTQDNIAVNWASPGANIGTVTPVGGTFTNLSSLWSTTLGAGPMDVITMSAPLIMKEFTNNTGPDTSGSEGAIFVGLDNSLYYRNEANGVTTNLLAVGAELAGINPLGQRSPFWEVISPSRIIVATPYGVENISVGASSGRLSSVSSAKGSGFTPVELEVVTGKYVILLTEKTLDFYTIYGDEVVFGSSIELRNIRPTDISFRDTEKLLVTYQTGFEMFKVKYKQASIYQIEGGVVYFNAE